MQLVAVTHAKDGQLKDPGVMLMFPTVLGNTAFLNVAMDGSTRQQSAVDRLEREGWKPGVVEVYARLQVPHRRRCALALGDDRGH